MDPTLRARVRFPPPAAGARILSRADGTRAGFAANAGVAFGIEGVPGKLVFQCVGFHSFGRPVSQGIQLQSSGVCGLDLDLADRAAAFMLVAPDPGYPGVECAEFAGQRTHLANLAAEHSLRHTVIEEVRTVTADHGFYF